MPKSNLESSKGTWSLSPAAVIDRLVHYAEIIAIQGVSYRLKDCDIGRIPATTDTETSQGVHFQSALTVPSEQPATSICATRI